MPEQLIDSNLWIDYGRTRTSPALLSLIDQYVSAPGACLAEPVMLEVLRNASEAETRALTGLFASLPILSTPSDVWAMSIQLSRQCRRAALTVGALDLIIACVALHHGTELVTFDRHFVRMAELCSLKVVHLQRPV